MRECPARPPDALAALRGRATPGRVRLWNGTEAWLMTRYADVHAVLTDLRFSSNPRLPGFPLITRSHQVFATQEAMALMQLDPPRHARVRRMLAADFTRKRVAALRPRIEEIMDCCAADLAAAGQPADLVARFAAPASASVMAELLGIPGADREFFQRRSVVRLDWNCTKEQAVAAQRELEDYLGDLIDRRLREPGQDLLSRLAAGYLSAGELTLAETRVMGVMLLQAGHATVGNMISLSVLSLLTEPSLMDSLAADPALVPATVDELLRFHSIPEIGLPRIATEDVTIGGARIGAGDAVIVSLGAANHDPERFPDAGRLLPGRNSAGQLSFGAGIHGCIGHGLARLQLEAAIGTVIRRFPRLRLAAGVDELPFHQGLSLHGLHALPVAWSR